MPTSVNPLKKLYKISYNKFISVKLLELQCRYFLLFTTVYESSQPSNFLHVNFFITFSMDSNSASNSVFLTPI